MAQLGDVCERRRWRRKRTKRSGSDLPIGEEQSDEDRGLVTTGRARGAQKINNEVWLSLGTFVSAAGGGRSEQKGVAVTCRLASCKATKTEA